MLRPRDRSREMLGARTTTTSVLIGAFCRQGLPFFALAPRPRPTIFLLCTGNGKMSAHRRPTITENWKWNSSRNWLCAPIRRKKSTPYRRRTKDDLLRVIRQDRRRKNRTTVLLITRHVRDSPRFITKNYVTILKRLSAPENPHQSK
jgi:hypothetical protein